MEKVRKFEDLEVGKVYEDIYSFEPFLRFLGMLNDYLAKFVVVDYDDDLGDFFETIPDNFVFLNKFEIKNLTY